MSYSKFTIPTTWSLGLSLSILAAVIVGGSKSIWGVFAGTFVIFGVDSLILQNIPFFNKYPGSSMLFNGILIIVIVMFYPGGLSRLFINIKRDIQTSIKKRLEIRELQNEEK